MDSNMKKSIEKHWKDKLSFKRFDPTNVKDKFYVLSMFPYPSGNLHMGHVRVYTISDAIARFHRLNGKNVFHPMGWDAFGLPAENAAIQRNIPADQWTRQNIEQMRKQLNELGCSFDWQAELATCDPSYYKWTQKLFLMLYENGLVYQKKGKVNWDPVDKTVLANEQVDANGFSWRSGAKVEKKLLKQWYVKATKFSEQLYKSLDDPLLEDWRDIAKIQRHWIGESDGWNFELKAGNQQVTVWTKNPEDLIYAGFLAISKDHSLNEEKIEEGLLSVMLKNPFGRDLPILVTSAVEFPPFNDVYIGKPSKSDADFEIAQKHDIRIETSLPLETPEEDQAWVLEKAQELGIGGDFKVSSKLQDWLISRQRYWGTPIPIVHCDSCGAVPVNDNDLPVKLPELNGNIGQPLNKNEEWIKCSCPKCGNESARRECDTMDTFVDSSWYFLRFLDPKNQSEIVNKNLSNSLMPVDVYIGGKEHAELHLYYARFINHFLQQKGFVKHPEPFKRLLVQGMVKGQSYRVKNSGQYLKANEVEEINGKHVEKSTGNAVVTMWEKMSKSKFNGVDPVDMIEAHGCDTMRLIMLADVGPRSDRNWSEATFPGAINWQKRLWLTVHDFVQKRENASEAVKSETFDKQESELWEELNHVIRATTFHFKYSHLLSVSINFMQSLTSAIRRSTPDVVALGENYERALAAQIIMLAPITPHFCSELWVRLQSAKNRINKDSKHIHWNEDVFSQSWPKADAEHKVEFSIKANDLHIGLLKISTNELCSMTKQQAMMIAMEQPDVIKSLEGLKVYASTWMVNEDFKGTLTMHIEKTAEKAKKSKIQKAKKQN